MKFLFRTAKLMVICFGMVISIGIAGCYQEPHQQDLAVIDYGPKSIDAGAAFNVQPDGASAAWFRMNHSMEGSTVWVNFGGANIQADISDNLVTVKVPPQLYSTPNTVNVVVTKVGDNRKVSAPAVAVKIEGAQCASSSGQGLAGGCKYDSEPNAAHAPVPKYIKAVTYFGHAWPINFWTSDLSGVEEDMKRVRADGFNSVVFVVPWGEFQPGLDPIRYDQQMYGRLSDVCKSAKAAGLDAFFRVSYEWDFASDVQLPAVARANELFTSDRLQPAWTGYLSRIKEATASCAKGYFLSWEDYWHVLDVASSGSTPKESARISKLIGFDEWAVSHASDAFRKRFKADRELLGAYPVPRARDPDFSELYAWFDEQLSSRLLARAAQVLPNMSIEARVDSDPIYMNGEISSWYSHKATYSVPSSKYLMTYWAPAMGAQNKGEIDTAKSAIARFVYNQKKILEHTDNHLFVEQLLYTDNTPKMAHNAKINPKQMGEFLSELSGPLLQFTSGYALWGYQNYRANLLYNPDFALGKKGWETTGTVVLQNVAPLSVNLRDGGVISQQVPTSRDHYVTFADNVQVKMTASGDGEIEVALGDRSARAQVKGGAKEITMVLPDAATGTAFSIRVLAGSVTLSRLYAYRFIQASSARDDAGNDLPDMAHIRTMNQKLEALDGLPSVYSSEAGNLDRVVGTYGIERDGQQEYSWAGPKVSAYVKATGSYIEAKGTLNVSMFDNAICSLKGAVNGVEVVHLEHRQDGAFSLKLPIPADQLGRPVKIGLNASCQTHPAPGRGDQRILSYVLSSLGVPN
ncbi:hypothetical protein [Xanthomonas arboricola]|uniref:hypothetical protein n=1 Tax=Xanthomonas arboricola TaxID=56448 RepID=UPI001612A59A|nr:hypothetical protein [Xanthomonas arboricola]MBB5676235.1 hypothetical protein [Xanthomonas arboricola]